MKAEMDAPATRSQKTIGALIAAASLALFFAWGGFFQLFGRAIRLDFATVGFFGWPLIGMFGVGYAHAGRRGGARMAAGFAVLVAIAVLRGVLRGAYG